MLSCGATMTDFQLPRLDHRLAIMGRNGSGKTQAAAWFLSHASFDKQPYVIIDYKWDQLLNSIPRLEEIQVTSRIPKAPGLYIVHPLPMQETEVEELLWRIWERERIGIYVDEAHMLPDKGAFRSLLTQGRSKRIPMITLAQRPAWINRFNFSEANFYCIFHLNDRRDHKTVEQFVPVDLTRPLPQYHSWYHDVDKYQTYLLKPVPSRDMILDRFNDRMPRSWFGSRMRQRSFL